jgi:hypothetical protein
VAGVEASHILGGRAVCALCARQAKLRGDEQRLEAVQVHVVSDTRTTVDWHCPTFAGTVSSVRIMMCMVQDALAGDLAKQRLHTTM